MQSVPAHYPMQGGPPPPNVPDPRQRIARFRTLTRRALSYWPTAFLIVLVGSIIAVFVASRIKRVYKSEAVILFKPGMTHGNDEEKIGEKAIRIAPKLKEMLITKQRLEPLINEYKLYPKIVDSRGALDAVEEMRNHIGFRGRDSETFVISFDADDAEVTQKVTQKLTASVIDEFSRGNVSSTSKQLEFLQVEMTRSEEEVEKANKGLAIFLAQHPEFASAANQLGQGGALAIPQQALSASAKHPGGDAQLTALFDQKRRIEQEASAAAGQPAAPSIPAAILAKVENAKRNKEEAYQRLAQAQADFSEKKSRYTEQHPDFLSAKAGLTQAQGQAQQADRELAAAQAEVPQAPTVAPSSMSPELRGRLDAVNGQIAARQAEIRNQSKLAAANPDAAARIVMPGIVELEIEWQRLLRSVRESKSAHEDLKAKFDKAKLTASAVAGTGGDQLEVLDPAFLPSKPSKGGRTNAAILGVGVAVLIAILYAYGRVVFSDTLVDQGDIEALQVIPVLGVMPKVATSPTTAVTVGAGAPAKEGMPGGV